MEMVEELEDRSYMCALEVPVFICIHLDNERAIYKTDKIEKRFVKIATVGLLHVIEKICNDEFYPMTLNELNRPL